MPRGRGARPNKRDGGAIGVRDSGADDACANGLWASVEKGYY